jgi:tetratricopeptide (TPR) repeat protein
MRCHFKASLFVSLALATAFFTHAAAGRAKTEMQQPKPSTESQAQEAEPEYSEDEYNAFMSASKEPDLLKRGAMLIEFINKYPKSKMIASYIDPAYNSLLFECSNDKKYQELETLAEQWLKLHPDNLQTIAYLASAAKNLGNDEKYVQCLLKIYGIRPTGSLANDIAQTYKKMKDQAKYLEWAATVFKYPEYDGDFMLRWDLVQLYTDEKDFAKAAEWAQATLKAIDAVKEPSAETQKQMRAVRHACYHLIGMNQYENGKLAEAIKSLQRAIRSEKYSEGYYYIGLCLQKMDKIDDAMLWYAKAELQGGEGRAPKLAKENLEKLYKALHNNNLTGIEKIYKKAKEQPDSYWTSY